MTSSAADCPPQSSFRKWARKETTGGILLLVAALAALTWANSPFADSYYALSATRLGPAQWNLSLPLSVWASDGLLAVFFFVVGVELRHEASSGSLASLRQAMVPVLAAVGGMIVPALIFAATVILGGDPEASDGWAIPTATDIAFALAVLAVFGKGLPLEVRTFLLTLAAVDDLLAIVVIALFYSESLNLLALTGALAVVGVFAMVSRSRAGRWYLLVPLALLTWILMDASGVHATIAGVLLGLSVSPTTRPDQQVPDTQRFADAVRPWSSMVVLPVFAFFAAGVTFVGTDSHSAFAQPVAWAVILGLCVGKFAGVLGTAAVVTKVTPLRLPDSIGIRDLLPVGFLAGIGFTVSLLVTELAFPPGVRSDSAKTAILSASVISGLCAAIFLRWSARQPRSHMPRNTETQN